MHIGTELPENLSSTFDPAKFARVCIKIAYKVKKSIFKSREEVHEIELLLAKGVSRKDQVTAADEQRRDKWFAALQHLVAQEKQESGEQSHGGRESGGRIAAGMDVEARFRGKSDWRKATVMKEHPGKGGTTYDLKYANGKSVSEPSFGSHVWRHD